MRVSQCLIIVDLFKHPQLTHKRWRLANGAYKTVLGLVCYCIEKSERLSSGFCFDGQRTKIRSVESGILYCTTSKINGASKEVRLASTYVLHRHPTAALKTKTSNTSSQH